MFERRHHHFERVLFQPTHQEQKYLPTWVERMFEEEEGSWMYGRVLTLR